MRKKETKYGSQISCLAECDLFLTNDKQLKQFKEIPCVTVGELFSDITLS